jgi:large subunit ribosomal protein L17
MRHANTVKKLGRTHAHRKATMAALSGALIRHKRITTTLAKAKALRGWVEPILHRAKDDSTHSRRLAFRDLGSDKEAVKVLFDEIAGAVGDRPGGYTRVVKLGQRAGDASEMAVIEIVDFNDVRPEGASGGKRKTRRSRRPAAGRTGAEAKPAAEPKAAAAKPAAKAAPAAKKGEPDDFTKLHGVGPVMAEALHSAGIKTFRQLAKADLQTLRDAVEEHTKVTEESANEETWSAQAALAAAGDWDGLAAHVEGLTTGTVEEESVDAAAETTDVEETPTPEDAIAQEPGAPPADEPRPADALPGEAGEGPPPPEAGPETRGRSGHRG